MSPWLGQDEGARGTTIVYAHRFVPEGERRRARETGDEAHAIPFLSQSRCPKG
jgi:antirestriction protein ArdC